MYKIEYNIEWPGSRMSWSVLHKAIDQLQIDETILANSSDLRKLQGAAYAHSYTRGITIMTRATPAEGVYIRRTA